MKALELRSCGLWLEVKRVCDVNGTRKDKRFSGSNSRENFSSFQTPRGGGRVNERVVVEQQLSHFVFSPFCIVSFVTTSTLLIEFQFSVDG